MLALACAAYTAVDGKPSSALSPGPELAARKPLKERLSVKHAEGVSNACAQCGYDEDSVANCCHPGGSWKGTCCEELEVQADGRKVCKETPTKSGEHTFTEGYDICHGDVAANVTAERRDSKWWSIDKLSHLYKHGEASNHLAKVGLTMHCFDQTEDPQQLWKPCTQGFCSQFKEWWSASIINTQQHNTYGGSGIILSPSWTKILCSHWADMGTMMDGCHVNASQDFVTEKEQREAREADHQSVQNQLESDRMRRKTAEADRLKQRDAERKRRDAEREARDRERKRRYGKALKEHFQPFKPTQLKEMLEHSMTERGAPFNEVLIDSQHYMQNLPESVAAVFYFHDASVYDRILATRAYVGMLDAYNLTESDLKLLKINHNAVPLMNEGTVMADDSANARQFLKHHPFGKYRQKPYERIPKEARRWRLRNEAKRPSGATGLFMI